jgi:SSS family solute:Na+ symporter
MSTIEALVHSASTLFTLELYHKIKTDVSDEKLILAGRICSTIVLLLGAAWAPVVGKFPTIFEFFQKCWFFFAGPVASVFILAILWKRMTARAAFWTLAMCFPLFILPYALRIGEIQYGWQMNEFNLAGIIFIFSLAFAVIVSLFTAQSGRDQVEGLVWVPSLVRLPEEELAAGYPWYANLWLWSGIWVAVMTAIYIKFW